MSIVQIKNIRVVAAVIESKGTLLCVQRGINARSYISCKWEFPGGKIEPGEDHATALTREIAEELRLSIEIGPLLLSVDHTYAHFHLTMYAYRCALMNPASKATLTEHIALRWLSPSDPAFKNLDWAAADLPIVALLSRDV
jgi:8-oxo-dGTP diphosphatase